MIIFTNYYDFFHEKNHNGRQYRLVNFYAWRSPCLFFSRVFLCIIWMDGWGMGGVGRLRDGFRPSPAETGSVVPKQRYRLLFPSPLVHSHALVTRQRFVSRRGQLHVSLVFCVPFLTYRDIKQAWEWYLLKYNDINFQKKKIKNFFAQLFRAKFNLKLT